MSGVEIRPCPDSARQRRVMEGCKFEVDNAAGQVTWWPDGAVRPSRGAPLRLALPGHGSPALTRVVRARYASARSGPAGSRLFLSRLWLVDENNRVVGRSAAYQPLEVQQLWPSDVLQPLEELGVSVVDRSYRRRDEIDDEFSNAFPAWWVGSTAAWPWIALGTLVVLAVIIAIIVTN